MKPEPRGIAEILCREMRAAVAGINPGNALPVILARAARKGKGNMKETVIRLIDDIDGKRGDESITFSYDGQTYEIDLSSKNAKELRKTFAPYLDKARRAPQNGKARRVTQTGKPAHTVSARERSQEIREWAKAQGIPVRDRGRIPADVISQYESAGS